MALYREKAPAPQVYTDAPSLAVARAVLGVTLRLEDPVAWARGPVSEVFRSVVAQAPAGSWRWFASSVHDGWQSLGEAGLARIGADLDLPWHLARPRHPLRVRVADAPGAGERVFHYRELDPERGGGSSYLQVFLPATGNPDDLLGLCLELANAGPFTHGVAGYHASWNRRDPTTSFACLRPWCRRYAGLHVEDPDELAARADEGLPATGWITLLGDRFVAARPDLAALLTENAWPAPARSLRARHGTLVIAGEAPTLGDLNALLFPQEYAEVAARLAPWMLPAPPPFRTWPDDPDEALAWHRRYVDAAAWQQALGR